MAVSSLFGSSSASLVSAGGARAARKSSQLGVTKGAREADCSLSSTWAAFKTGLSATMGIEPWPGVPVTFNLSQTTPFSPTKTDLFLPDAVGTEIPPLSVMTAET